MAAADDNDVLGEPTEVGLVRPAPFHPEQLFVSALMTDGNEHLIKVGRDPALAEQLANKDVFMFPYRKLELPRDPERKKKDPLSLPMQWVYAEYNTSDRYLKELQEELWREDVPSKTHTDVLVGSLDYKQRASMFRVGDRVVMAVGLRVPSDYPVPVFIRVLPEIARCLLHNLVEYHELGRKDEQERLSRWSVLRYSSGPLQPGNPRESLFCASLGPLEDAASLEETQTLSSRALQRYKDLFVKARRQ